MDFISIAIGHFTKWILFSLILIISPICLYFNTIGQFYLLGFNTIAIGHFTIWTLFQLLLDIFPIAFYFNAIGYFTNWTLFRFLLDILSFFNISIFTNYLIKIKIVIKKIILKTYKSQLSIGIKKLLALLKYHFFLLKVRVKEL